jgi:hypothetical protein
MLIGAKPELGELGSNHRSLTRVKVPPFQVHGDDIRRRVVALVILESAIDPGLHAGPVSTPTVKDPLLVENDRLANPVLADVLDERIEWRHVQGLKLINRSAYQACR